MSNIISNEVFGVNVLHSLRKEAIVCFIGLLFVYPALLSNANGYYGHNGSFLQPNTKISGVVVDKDGFPMPGVTIQVKGTTTGVAMLCVSQYDVIH
jgi:hypothetical protein